MKSQLIKSTLLTICTSGLAATASQAAIITWGSATDISTGAGNSSDVSTNGTVVEAFNAVSDDQIGTALAITVNTVEFTPTTSLLGSGPKNSGASDFSITTNGGDATYDALVSTLEYGGGTGNVNVQVGGGNLVTNDNYEIQIWFSDTRAAQDARIQSYGDGEGSATGNQAHLNDQFVIGTFTADAANQTLILTSGGGDGMGANFGQSHINAYQIRSVSAVPEPSTTLLGGLAGLSLLVRRRS